MDNSSNVIHARIDDVCMQVIKLITVLQDVNASMCNRLESLERNIIELKKHVTELERKTGKDK